MSRDKTLVPLGRGIIYGEVKNDNIGLFLHGLVRMFRQSSAELSVSFNGKYSFPSNRLR